MNNLGNNKERRGFSMKLTVIIPVYNREKTIEKAIVSVAEQLREDMECIVLNDGSTDHTEEVIQECLSKYGEKISYYKKENEGIAATRNFGITHAKGEYILFVDSDDYIEPHLLETIKPYFEQEIDIIKYKAKHVDENGKELTKITGPNFSNKSGEEAFNLLAFTDVLMDSPCVYAFKKDLFIKNKMFFKTGTYHEDFGLIPLILLTAKTVVSIDYYGYCYVQSNESITRNQDYEKTKKRWEDALFHYDNMLQWISQNELDIKTKENVKTYYTNAILLKLGTIKKEDRKPYVKQIKQRKMTQNIKPKNIRQFIKRILLTLNINWYLANKK